MEFWKFLFRIQSVATYLEKLPLSKGLVTLTHLRSCANFTIKAGVLYSAGPITESTAVLAAPIAAVISAAGVLH